MQLKTADRDVVGLAERGQTPGNITGILRPPGAGGPTRDPRYSIASPSIAAHSIINGKRFTFYPRG